MEKKPIAFHLNLILFCQGDNNALGILYKQWLPELYLVAFRYLKSTEEAEDVVADCFEKLIMLPVEKRQQKFIENQINIKALMIVIVKNKCLDHLKTTKNRGRIIDTIKNLWSSTTPNLVNQKFTEENFESLFFCLLDKEQIILKLNMDGFTHQEISAQLNISEKTISNTLSISRNKIRELWAIFME
ncbi:RNA polymerase sigma factor [Flavobacterium sp.]|uniref:RNA polymerase sigma factor n=1 Tax=Flavobacterium sp. TaxID=239 RepID=UPI001B6B4013|nr:RNA polymerase sigma factor [Flavobacterium sp.]MBP6181422.1 RNA polymerase sigma factor [Flavobacterium sp.]